MYYIDLHKKYNKLLVLSFTLHLLQEMAMDLAFNQVLSNIWIDGINPPT